MTNNTKSMKAGRVKTTKSRSGKIRSMPATTITKGERIVGSNQVPAVEHESAVTAALSTVLGEQVADAATPEEGIAPDAPLAAPADMTEVGPSGTAKPARQSKKAKLLGLLQRPEGASLAELMAATGWQSHSVRAALTGFRKEGRELLRTKDEAGLTRYRLSAQG